jgi:hypothetical protein
LLVQGKAWLATLQVVVVETGFIVYVPLAGQVGQAPMGPRPKKGMRTD